MAPLKSKASIRKAQKKAKKRVVEIGTDQDDDSKPGCVYLGHVPHGFYEEEMRQYFTQFGRVLNVRVCRSKRTNNSKGYGFVKFRYSAVAKTVAETCHNYLFMNKLLKCEYKPMSEIHSSTFKKSPRTAFNLPKARQNNARTQQEVARSASRSIGKANKKLDKLKAAAGMEDVCLSDIMNVPDVSEMKKGEVKTNRKNKRKRPRDQSGSSNATPETDGGDDATTTNTPAVVTNGVSPQPVAKRRKMNASLSSPSSSIPSDTAATLGPEPPTTPAASDNKQSSPKKKSTPTPKKKSPNTNSQPTPQKQKSTPTPPPQKKSKTASTPTPRKPSPSVTTPTPKKTKLSSTPTPKKKSNTTPAVLTPKTKSTTPTPKKQKSPNTATPKTKSASTPTPTLKKQKSPHAATPTPTPKKQKSPHAATPTPTPKKQKSPRTASTPTPKKTGKSPAQPKALTTPNRKRKRSV